MFTIMQLFAAALVAGAPISPMSPISPAPSPAHRSSDVCVTPEHTGTFRVTATMSDGTQSVPAVLLLENIEGCLEATFITDGSSPAAIDHLAKSGDSLQGRLNVTGSDTQVTLRFDGAGIAGSIIGKKQSWKLEGRKTS